ncbi:G-patch domain-containing protein [Colletotrichum abscissum]|uniref:G-patch domain-containing protein n=1 Tax=Colletotrichum abscissum TaxID=1671311 RepID=A0A9Q0AZM6_9PEZI|nr:G-patch domain-containing protein [Colletotrichum abscissum]KAI3535152.1 G-patch domain-containing protein [Colletotrichum abscissum]KAK1491802.1 G-patch domain-containing protein [Colletotrichum abscissum]
MAAPPPPPPPARGGLSLYANLLDPVADPSATISSAPVRYNQDGTVADPKDGTAVKKPIDPSLRFQPIRRPQAKTAKPKPNFPKTIPSANTLAAATSTAASSAPTSSTAAAQQPPPPKSTLADWAVTEEDEWRYSVTAGAGAGAGGHQRGGRRKKKKKGNNDQPAETNWDDIYDPTKPTNVEEYLRSDERIHEVQEWKRLLYRHRRRKSLSDGSDEETERRPAMNQFAPPAEYSFVPPPPTSPPPAEPRATEAAIGDDAYARRQALSASAPPPPPPPPAVTDEATISRAPVRYTPSSTKQPPADEGDPSDPDSPPPTLGLGASRAPPPPPPPASEEAQAPRSSRPGQAGFAQRLMSKYGWTKGSGLGADESGIVNPLRVQVEKRKKKSDAEGGGWAEPGNRAKVIGGKRKDETDGGSGGKFGGPMSEVIVLQRMLDNMEDLQGEIANGLGQEIGEECGEKYGRVERLYIDVEKRQVFIRFTDQVSALRAVNELDGRVFNGNVIVPKFFDTEKFDKGIYQ